MQIFIRIYFFVVLGVFCALFNNFGLANKSVLAGSEQIILKPREFVIGTIISTSTKYYLQQKTAGPYQLFNLQSKQGKLNNTSTLSLQFFGDIMLERNVAKVMGAKGLKYIFASIMGVSKSSSAAAEGAGPLRQRVSVARGGLAGDCETPPHPPPTAPRRGPAVAAICGGEGLLGGADITVANLEGPFAPKRINTSKSIAFRFDPKYANELAGYGFNLFNLANNHLYDMGRANVAYTKKILSENNLGYFGDELSVGPEFTYVTSGIAFVGINSTVYYPNLKKLEQIIKEAKQKSNYLVVNVHWGAEYQRKSTLKQQQLARWLVDHGVDIIIGHHPHVTQEMEVYKNKPIFYSLGNFVFDQYFSTNTQEGLSVGVILQDNKLQSLHLFPIYGVKSQVYVMGGERRDNFLKWFIDGSRLGDKKIESGILNFE